MIYRQEDLPFDKDGISPDLIMNPHAVPSRMTINMLLEMALNLVGCATGTYPDASTFSRTNIEEELTSYLTRLRWTEYSSTMYSGTTGEKFRGKVFMAPAFYQRLKHLVAGKMHSRMSGPIDALTHQPVAGRSRDGGLRFGEMERDCMLSHGSTRILKECLFDQSDKYQVNVCELCGIITNSSTQCGSCDGVGRVVMKNMPFATKLLFQELVAMGLRLKIE